MRFLSDKRFSAVARRIARPVAWLGLWGALAAVGANSVAWGQAAPASPQQPDIQKPPYPQIPPTTPIPLPVTSNTPGENLPRPGAMAQPSPVNPFPRGTGDNQNKGRAVNDLYWGVVDGNLPAGNGPGASVFGPNVSGNRVPSRVQMSGTDPRQRILELDGWGFPRGASLNGAFLLSPTLQFPQSVADLGLGLPTGSVFVLANGPSTETSYTNPGTPIYYRAPAVPRPNVSAQDIPETQKFTWNLSTIAVRGATLNQQTSFQVQVFLPTPPEDELNVAPNGPENRITDAQYTVYYYLQERNGGGGFTYYPKQKTYIVSQTGAGYVTLNNEDGNPAFFPFYSSTTPLAAFPPQPGLGVPFQGVKLDNTTTDMGTDLYVLAEALNLVPVVDNVAATPTVTPPHGGRWRQHPNTPSPAPQPNAASATGAQPIASPGPNEPTTGTSIAAGTRPLQPQPFQPGVGGSPMSLFNPDYEAEVSYVVNPSVDANVPVGNYSRYFINNPYDPLYGLTGVADPARPQDPTIGFEPWNPTTLFRGPESLVDPRLLDTQSLPIGVAYPPPTGPGTGYAVGAAPPPYPFNELDNLPGRPVFPTTPGRPQVPRYDPIEVNPATGLPLENRTETGERFTRPASSVDANNHDVYRRNRYRAYQPDPTNLATYNPAVPIFSQMQVIIARTEYALDPEPGIPFAAKDGTRSIRVGAVYSVDWLSGGLIWRFPDRSHVPGNSRNPYLIRQLASIKGTSAGAPLVQTPNTTTGADQTTYDVGSATVDPATGRPMTLIPGIAQVDKNLDGFFDDDEVFIVGQGNNAQGGLFASVTIAPQVAVRGQVQIPNYFFIPANQADENGFVTPYPRSRIRYNGRTDARAVKPAPSGRYFNPATFGPVLVGVAYVASENGVIYAIDAYGNNDNDYFAATETRDVRGVNFYDYRNFGVFRPGSTNVLWSFTANNTPQRRDENRQAYYERLKQDIPATSSFGASAPVLAYRRDEDDFTQGQAGAAPTDPLTYYPLDPFAEELRLFIGNSNGVAYAMDGRADGGRVFDATGNPVGVGQLPFRRESFRPVAGTTGGPAPITTFGPVGLRWWFETRGSINAPAAVSVMRGNAGGTNGGNNRNVQPQPADLPVTNTDPFKKGVYFTTQEGRVYCCDWDGPVSKVDHNTPVTFGFGADAATLAANAALLNDTFRFHNVTPATALARVDYLEGDIRPRWVFPNLYRDIDGTDNTLLQPADNAIANPGVTPADVAGKRLGEPEAFIGAINSAPTLIDFPWTDPLTPGAAPRHLSYLAFVALDAPTGGIPASTSRFYLLDQVGDRANFLSNPRVRGGGAAARVFANPRDRFIPNVQLSDASPVWAYRHVYDTYANTVGADTSTRNMALRNSPLVFPDPVTGPRPPLLQAELATFGTNVALPGRKTVPTVYFAGLGRLFAIDFDEETGLLMRYRPTIAATRALTPLPEGSVSGFALDSLYPDRDDERDLIQPGDLVLTGVRAPLRIQRILARTLPLPGSPTAITSLTHSGGPPQNRNTPIAYRSPSGTTSTVPTNPTVPSTTDNVIPPDALPGVVASVLGLPTHEPPLLQPDIFSYVDGRARTLDPTVLAFRFDQSGLRVNQDINDPLTTTEGALSSSSRFGFITNPVVRAVNTAYQYPAIFVTNEDGFLFEVSSNTEGEDRSRLASEGRTFTVGWALYGYTDGIDFPSAEGHQIHFVQRGPGGTSGAAVVSNVHFNSLDAYTRNYRRRRDEETANPGTPDRYRLYPFGEPNTATPTPVNDTGIVGVTQPAANNDDPRPDFKPRRFSPGSAATAGPDGISGNADDLPAIVPDVHTGQTGFPLDMNGRFFDKQYAGKSSIAGLVPRTQNDGYLNPVGGDFTRITGQDPNADYAVKIRVPGYSYIGGSIDQTGFVDPNNQVPDGARPDNSSIAGNPLAEASGNADTDDINPSAQNVAWVYTGGIGGLAYAFTPALPGQSSGLGAGIPQETGGDGGANPNLNPVIVDDATYDAITGATGPTFASNVEDTILAGALVAQGRRTVYEWGERLNILIPRVLAETAPRILPGGGRQSLVNVGQPTVPVEIRSENTSQLIFQGNANLERDGGTPRYYPSDPADPNSTRVGIAAIRVTVGAGVSQTRPWTPGDVLRISARQTGSVRRNGRVVELIPNATVLPFGYLSIANPLAVQGFAMNGYAPPGQPVVPANVRKADARDTANGIGPFHSSSESTGGDPTTRANAFPKDRLVDTLNTPNLPVPFTDDPDRFVAEYHQALTNGNSVLRRDLRPGVGTGARTSRNPRFNTILRQQSGGNEPTFYFPVLASAHVIGHGRTGTTDVTPQQQNLRVLNRSLLTRVNNIRMLPAESVLLWRSWPGLLPNAPADTPPSYGPNPAENNGNPRLNPVVMNFTGEMNRLPWEDPIVEARPYNTAAPTIESADYPHIPTRNDAVRVLGAPGNFTASGLPLNALVNNAGGSGRKDNVTPALDNGAVSSVANATRPSYRVPQPFAVAASVAVPKYQPANLVGIHNLTSTYKSPSFDDNTSTSTATGVQAATGLNSGPVQLPRGPGGIAERLLYPYPPGTDTVNTTVLPVLSPYGYTTRMLAMVDYDNTGRLTAQGNQQRNTGINPNNRVVVQPAGSVNKAYREFELAFGVPADMSLQVAESVVDVGKLSHGFGIQNFLLGYGVGNPTYQSGFLPSPLFNVTAFPRNLDLPNNKENAPYRQFFKKYTVQNTGNVNLWNLRATQRTEVPDGTGTLGSGFPFRYFGLRSTTVDPNFGILAAGADPNGALVPTNVMPQVVTSLDRQFDAAWDAYYGSGETGAKYGFGQTSALNSSQNIYQAYYQQLAGRHTLHKPLPNATAPSVLGVPDVPTSKLIADINGTGGLPPFQPLGQQTVVGVAVPLGTPSGIYDSTTSPTPFAVFEDHDTNEAYNPVPYITSLGAGGVPVVAPAGPFYAGTNLQHPGQGRAPGTSAILTGGGGTAGATTAGEGIWRPRRVVNTTTGGRTSQSLEYLPFTQNFALKAQVTEANLTGLVPDRAVDTPGGNPGSVITGLLPNIDLFPLIDRTGDVLRPAAALSPAAFRSPDGRLHTFFARNGQPDSATGAFAQPGQPFRLYHSVLNWNNPLGTWQATSSGNPLANVDGNPPSGNNNTARWFNGLQELNPNRANPNSVFEANTQPYVLQTFSTPTTTDPAGSPVGATLFFVNTTPVQNGTPLTQIMYARLNSETGDPVGEGQPFFAAYDPSILRFGPRAVYEPNTANTLLFFYGGTSGRFSLYYASRPAGTDGTPTGAAPNVSAAGQRRRENPLPLPPAFATVSDPAPVLRDLQILRNGGYQTVRVVDVYYTGVSRATQTPDVYMTRYEVLPGRGQVNLQPLTLPRVVRDRLFAPGRAPLYQGKHIAWARNLNSRPDLPVIYVGPDPNNPQSARRITNPTRWQFDQATGTLFQVFRNAAGTAGTDTYVYVDTSAGTVRFRGPETPRKTQYVFADYQPQTYRITSNGASNVSPFTFNEDRIAAPSSGTNVVVRRPQPMNIGRNWTFWQKGAQGAQRATLFYAPRRIGVDLKSLNTLNSGTGAAPALGVNDSVQLSERDTATFNQVPLVTQVQVGVRNPGAAGYPNVPLTNAVTITNFEVDFASGKIFLEPQYEGLDVDVTFVPTTQGLTGAGVTARGRLDYIEERNIGSSIVGTQVPMNNPVNEGQPYAFIDRYNPYASLNRTGSDLPVGIADPALSPFRVWLFWSSPRGRLGTQFSNFGGQAIDAYPGGYDLYWQTLAPAFEPQTFTGQPQ